jgi:hypothetical protein
MGDMTRLKLWLGALLAGLAALSAWGRAQRRRGAEDLRAKQTAETLKRTMEGRNAANTLHGADRNALLEQLRANTKLW